MAIRELLVELLEIEGGALPTVVLVAIDMEDVLPIHRGRETGEDALLETGPEDDQVITGRRTDGWMEGRKERKKE